MRASLCPLLVPPQVWSGKSSALLFLLQELRSRFSWRKHDASKMRLDKILTIS